MDIEKTLYLGSYERETHGRIPAGGGTAVFDKTVHRHSIGAFAVYTRTEDSAGTATRLSTIIKDHLGSTNAIVTATWNGSSFVPTDTERQSFDSWGERRDAETLVRFRIADTDPFRRSAKDHDRGYTGHEQLDDSGLIHMNGRIYDPELGRMLSPDPFVQIPEYSQNFNRYSYVLNNPLNKTDPSGYSWLSKAFDKVGDWFSENWRTVASIVVTGVLTVLTAGVATAAAVAVYGATSSIGLASAAAYAAWGATVGTLSGGFNAAIGGGDLGDVLRGSLVGGVTGALTGGLHMVGGNAGLAALNVVGHGVVGGASNVAMGGKFQDGFLSAAASASTAVTGLTSPESSPFNKAGRTIIASAAGGTASVIGGGKFANGAYTGAFAHLLNAEGETLWESIEGYWTEANRGAAVFLDTLNPFGKPYKTAGWYNGTEEWYQFSKGAADIGSLALAGATMGAGATTRAGVLTYAAASSTQSTDRTFRVIGTLDDTAHYINKPGHAVFTTESYSILKNMRWLANGISAGAPFKIVSPLTPTNLMNAGGKFPGPTAFGREISQLMRAGYGPSPSNPSIWLPK